MKKYILIIVLFTNRVFFAQEIKEVEVMRYYYQVNALVDISEKMIEREGTAIVDVFHTHSRFMDLSYYNRSKMQSYKDNNITNEELIQKALSLVPVFSWFIITDKESNNFYDRIGQLNNYYKEDKNEVKWDIRPTLLQWNEYNVQEATTSYGGREWTVLFTQEIPIQVGPYKFNNLPGLVVKAWDSEEHYIFEFLNSQKTNVIWEVNDLNTYTKSSKENTKKAMLVNSKKTFISDLEGTGITLSEQGQEFFNKKKNNYINPIERDY